MTLQMENHLEDIVVAAEEVLAKDLLFQLGQVVVALLDLREYALARDIDFSIGMPVFLGSRTGAECAETAGEQIGVQQQAEEAHATW